MLFRMHSGKSHSARLPYEPDLSAGRRGLPQLWRRQGLWQIKMRWAVAPLMIAGIVAGRLLGFEFLVVPIAVIAAVNLAYNAVFALVFGRYQDRVRSDPGLDRLFTTIEVVVDYAAIFLLIYFTGGVSSPLIVFLIFHVIITAIQFTAEAAYALAGVAAGGLWLLLAGEARGWLQGHHIAYRGTPLHLEETAFGVVMLGFYTATLFIIAGMVSRIVDRLRARVGDLAEATSNCARANERFRGLYRMLTAIGTERRMQPVLHAVAAETAKATQVPAVAIKLLDEDRLTLRYVAAYGLPEDLIRDKTIYLDRSPINRRVIEGETVVESNLDREHALQMREELRELGIRSVLLAPLEVEDRVIGTLSFYDRAEGRFGERNRSFLELVAELVAIAIDNARAYEAVRALMRERTEFMLEVAHNLRAPLTSSLSIVDLLTAGYLGEMNPHQKKKLNRLEDRLRGLNGTIGELLAIARARDRSREIEDVTADLEALADHTEEMFAGEAAAKGVVLEVVRDGDLPSMASGRGLLEQLMENLVSNAIKYTPKGGRVEVRFDHGDPESVRITVADTGIGIPEDEQSKLFREFFRASNARKSTRIGTGLGLVLAKQTVGRHGGTLDLTSAEGEGTTVVVTLPLERPGDLTPPLPLGEGAGG